MRCYIAFKFNRGYEFKGLSDNQAEKGWYMKNRVVALLLAFSLAAGTCLTGCGDKQEGTSVSSSKETTGEATNKETPSTEEKVEATDLSTPEAVLKFATGKWTLKNEDTDEAYAELEINADGTVKVKRDDSEKACDGTISFTETPNSRMVGVHEYDLNCVGLSEAFGSSKDESNSNGYFRVTQTAGTDYLVLYEVSNGLSFIAAFAFVAPDKKNALSTPTTWVFERENSIKSDEEPIKGEIFYASAISNTESGLLLQKLDDKHFDACFPLYDFVYDGIEFQEAEGNRGSFYKLASDADLSGIFYEDAFSKAHPLNVYEVTTDDNGDVKEICEVEKSFYNAYFGGDKEQEVTADGTTISVFTDQYTLAQLGNEGTAINGVETFGDYAIVEGHMGPHASEYSIFNLRNLKVERTISGANFVHGDKIWKSFYSLWNTVYDYEGKEVYTVDGTEIASLEIDGDKLKIGYWKDDYDTVHEETIDCPEATNAAIYAYADYMHRKCVKTWKEFLSYAPEGALFMVMINPFDDDEWIYSPSKAIDKGDTDHVYVVSLKKDLELEIDGNSSGKQGKGWNYRYDVMVSEGAPSHTIKATAPDGQTAEWPVTTISGEKDLRWIFK